MNPDDFPAPTDGFVLTHFLVVSDQDRSGDFYKSLLDGQVLLERDPVIMKVANFWIILNAGAGPTADKPTVTLTTPTDLNHTGAFLNVRVADIQRVYTLRSPRPSRAPASSTRRPARRWGPIATSSAAMGPYTSDAPSAQRRLAPA